MSRYIYVMGRRLQIMLEDRQHTLLLDEAGRTGLSMAELIRRAVDGVYRPNVRPKLKGFEFSVGLWRRPDPALAGRRPEHGRTV
jgi:hypothetical protein